MPHRLTRATNVALGINIFLLIIKGIVGIISNSIAVISEALNSFTDVLVSIGIKIAVKISRDKPDTKHQFGHNAAQPLAAFILAVFAFVVGINIVEESVKRLIEPKDIKISTSVYVVLIFTIVSKILLNRYQVKIAKMFKSPAIRAASIDSINDVLASSIALLGVIGASMNLNYIDSIAGIMVAMFIFKSGYEVAKENMDYLMGRSADHQFDSKIKDITLKINGVKGINDLRSHYVGNKFHVEIHIEVDKDISTKLSHDIGNEVKYALEEIEEVQKVFVHIDPI
ncbi:MAG: cation diffusion facilitator family transporter [Stygiobacter sp.]|jgi:cation diffusion facilitator family transporter|uniref:Cation diffusion facilitator family transporter n=1 Tax=Stygiobacter electus TaxID=3032292 RepID=A0AAE3TDD5_9BACT|nr:cation diffusion facilitator family transporter [Stygiobacter electus]MDF1612840.1 cation diffusion facilitator family transporter [Stygiobacter electus]